MRSEVVRLIAEHEAAHAVVARHFSHPVHCVSIREADDGWTAWDASGASRAERAAVTCAGDLWSCELGTVAYRDLGCADLERLVRLTGVGGVWSARRLARSVLTARRRAVLALADRLEVERFITFDFARPQG